MEQPDEDDTPQNSFLNVFDANKVAKVLIDEAAGPTDIKLTLADPTEVGQKTAPVIQELQSITFAEIPKVDKVEQLPVVVKFSWESADRVEAKYTFINQSDLVFITFNFKGYNKESDVRYALSENEILLEVRDVAKNKVHRVCKTLFQPIDCKESTVQLLVDYIVFKLKKEKNKSWDDLGYSIEDFNIPASTQYMRSNFLKQKSAEVGITENKENHSANTSPAQIEAEPSEEQIDKGYHKEGYVEPKKAELTEEEKAELA